MKPAMRLVPKAPSRMSQPLPSPFFPPPLKALPVYIELSLTLEAAPALVSVVISLFGNTGLCSQLSKISVRISMLPFQNCSLPPSV